jgi:PAS domain S-box-containing protein
MDTLDLSHNGELALDEDSSHSLPDQLLVLDAGLSIHAASKSFYTAFHLSPDEAAGRKLADVGIGQCNIPALLKKLSELQTTEGEFEDLEVGFEFPALGRRNMLVSAVRLAGDIGRSDQIVVAIRNGSGKKVVEAESGQPSAGFRAMLASIGYAVILADREGHVTFTNPAAERLTGWTPGQALHEHLTDVFHIGHEDPSQAVENPVASAIQAGAAVCLAEHTILLARDGSTCPIDGSTAPILGAAGSLTGLVVVFHDISSRRRAGQDLEISEVRYRRLFEAAHDGILILDAETATALDVNPFMCDLLGYPREHFLGRELWEIGVFRDAEMSRSAMQTLQRVGRIRYENLPLQHKDGRPIPVEFVSNVYREGRRNVIQCNIRDITERQHFTRDLAKARQDAEAANLAKSDFLANMSHEIRTPMGAILGFAEMLLHRSPEECAQIGCIQIIQRNARHLLELINEILDLSKVEAGQMKVERVSCDLTELLSEVIALMRPRAAEKGLGFEVTFHGPIPRLIQTDPLRLRQILVNLLGNAVKFTEAGKIALQIMDEGAGGPRIVLRVEVIDSGIGMTSEQLGRLFMPFTQSDASITRKFGGTGLGLTISRQLAKLLSGDVTANSRHGVGSTFTLKVDGGPSAGAEPLQDLTEATLPARVDQEVAVDIHLRGSILLVEDGTDNQRLLRMQLGDAGASVTSALNGQVAVDLATAQTFDLILMDMQMPVMDGYAATTELRRRGLITPIIALTAHAMAEDRDKCLASGCSGYLSKPVDEDKLLKTVHEHLGKTVDPFAATVDRALRRIAALAGPVAAPGDESSLIHSSSTGDPRIMAIVPLFVAGLPAQVSQMKLLLEQLNGMAGLQQLAHQLLGTCGGYGFAPVSQPARTVEQSIKAGHDRETVTGEVQSLIEVIRRIDGYDRSKEK